MATKRYATDYPAASPPNGAELVQVVQAAADKQLSLSNLVAWFRGLVNTYTKAQGVTPVALADGASIATDASTSNNFTVTLGGNRTLANPSNLVAGHVYNWIVRQDATGGRTLVYGSAFKWPGGSVPTLSTGANAVDLISAIYDGTILVANFNKGYA